jgi:exosome complex exonuclease DIS3/RRP44
MDLLEHEPSSKSTGSASSKTTAGYERGSKAAAAAAARSHLNAMTGPLSRCILLQTVIDECKHQNLSVFNRLQALLSSANRQHVMFANEHHRETYLPDGTGESPNDRNDRAIRVATQWFIKNHGHETDIVLITNDRANKKLAREEGIPAMSIQEYVRGHVKEYPELADLVAGGAGDDDDSPSSNGSSRRGGGDSRGKRRPRSAIFVPHLPMSALASGLVSGKFFQGSMRVNDYNSSEGKVKVRSDTISRPVVISGREHMNRAFDGDIVAIELLPKSEWGKVAKSTIRVRDDETGAEIVDGKDDGDADAATMWKGDLVDGGDQGMAIVTILIYTDAVYVP